MRLRDLHLSMSDISLSIMPSRSTHVATNGRISFCLMTEYYSIVFVCVYICIYTHIFFTDFFTNGHLGCFYSLAVVENAAMNIEVRTVF